MSRLARAQRQRSSRSSRSSSWRRPWDRTQAGRRRAPEPPCPAGRTAGTTPRCAARLVRLGRRDGLEPGDRHRPGGDDRTPIRHRPPVPELGPPRSPRPPTDGTSRPDAIPMITWQPDATTLDAINAGAADAVIRARARAVAAFGRPMFLRFAHEMNANWYPWDGTTASTPGTHDGPSKYVAAWRHVHDVFVAAGATNASGCGVRTARAFRTSRWNAADGVLPGRRLRGLGRDRRLPPGSRPRPVVHVVVRYPVRRVRSAEADHDRRDVVGRGSGARTAKPHGSTRPAATSSTDSRRSPHSSGSTRRRTDPTGASTARPPPSARLPRRSPNDPYFRTRPEPTGSTLRRWT